VKKSTCSDQFDLATKKLLHTVQRIIMETGARQIALADQAKALFETEQTCIASSASARQEETRQVAAPFQEMSIGRVQYFVDKRSRSKVALFFASVI
jgi:hypothetical protein